MDDVVFAVKQVAACEKRFRELDVSLEIDTDFQRFKEVCLTCGRGSIGRPFDPSFNDILPHNGFWVAGWKEGKLVFTVAVRMDDLQQMDLSTFWRRHLGRLFPEGDANWLDSDVDSELRKISGKVAYHGELWVNDHNRGSGIAPLVCLYSIAWAVIAIRPDWVVAIVGGAGLSGGLSFREGYTNAEPLIHEWRWAPGYIAKDEFLIWINRRDFAAMFSARNTGSVTKRGEYTYNIAHDSDVDSPSSPTVVN